MFLLSAQECARNLKVEPIEGKFQAQAPRNKDEGERTQWEAKCLNNVCAVNAGGNNENNGSNEIARVKEEC